MPKLSCSNGISTFRRRRCRPPDDYPQVSALEVFVAVFVLDVAHIAVREELDAVGNGVVGLHPAGAYAGGGPGAWTAFLGTMIARVSPGRSCQCPVAGICPLLRASSNSKAPG